MNSDTLTTKQAYTLASRLANDQRFSGVTPTDSVFDYLSECLKYDGMLYSQYRANVLKYVFPDAPGAVSRSMEVVASIERKV